MEKIPASETPLVLEEQKVLAKRGGLRKEQLWSLEGGVKDSHLRRGRSGKTGTHLGDRYSPSLEVTPACGLAL